MQELLADLMDSARGRADYADARVVRSVPGWRAGLMHFTSFTPSVSMRAERLFLWEGRRRMRKRV